jgi:hypothetical protein
MATYGIDFYSGAKYGLQAVNVLSVEPFNAEQTDYGHAFLTWSLRTGATYNLLRLIRSPYGFVVNVFDGDVLLDIDVTQTSATSYNDVDLEPGKFYYYTIFLGTGKANWSASLTYQPGDQVSYSGVLYQALKQTVNEQPDISGSSWTVQAGSTTDWVRAGDEGILAVLDFGYRDKIWKLTPRVYKQENVRDLDEDARNDVLYRFLAVFGFHFDLLRTQAEKATDINNAKNVQYKYLFDLGHELGIDPEPVISPRLERLRVQNATAIYREKGSGLGLQNLVNVVTGWDCTITIGNNLMLNGDQASFAHPQYDQWNGTINYATGDRVYYNAFVYTANSGGAYGPAQAPTGLATNNTWWNVITASVLNAGTTPVSPLINPLTGNVSTWEAYREDTGANVKDDDIVLASANALVPTDNTANHFKVTNNSGATVNVLARSVSKATGDTLPSKLQIAGDGIPIERPTVWMQGRVYNTGDIVLHNFIQYQALINSPVKSPTGNYTPTAEWKVYDADGQNSYSDFYLASLYVSIPETGGTAVPVQAYMEWFDENGLRLNTPFFPTSSLFGRLDTFNYPCLGTTNPTYPTAPWGLNQVLDPINSEPGVTGPDSFNYFTLAPAVANWNKINGVAYADSSAGIKTATGIVASADMSVYVTFRAGPAAPNTVQGLIFRWTNATNYWLATRTVLQKVVAGVTTTVTTYTTPLIDGERIFVQCAGSVITVKKYLPYSSVNGIQTLQLATTTDAFNSTATTAGMYIA